MFLFRTVLLGMGLLGAYVGSLSFQEGSGVDMVVGLAGIGVSLLCFFVLAKALWRIFGCMITFIIVAVVVGGLFYFISSSGVADKLMNIGKGGETQQVAAQSEAVETAETDGERNEIQALLDKLPELIEADEKEPAQPEPEQQGPKQIPIVVGKVTQVASGDLFRVNNVWVRLFGLAAPHINQTCQNKSNRTYNCGRIVAQKLKEIVGNDEITCIIQGLDIQGAALSTCTIMQDYDLGVVLVEEGWAVALRNITPVYIPYEDEAHAKKIGLWAGQFQAPWDWMDRQQKDKAAAANVKAPKPVVVKKKSKKSIFDVF